MAKSDNILTLLELLINGAKITSSDTEIQEKLGTSQRNLQRYLKRLDEKYEEIGTEVINRKTYYKVIKISDIVHKFLASSNDMSWLIQLMAESDKRIFSELEEETKERLKNVLSREKDVFLYQNSPFEVFEDEESKQIFRDLKSAVKNNEYRNIDYEYNNFVSFKEVNCLKMIFMENNWYVAIATKEDTILFLRISFIKSVKYTNKNSYQPTQIKQYREFFETFQNPMTLYGQPIQKAVILASPKVAKYFKADMKKLLTSQQFVAKREDGSVEFTLDYTQPMEILPLIKKWLPDLKIVSPQSLEDKLRADLKSYLA